MINPQQLAELFDLHASRLLVIARSFGSSEGGDAGRGWIEDAVQEAFMALAKQEGLPEDPLAWLVRVTRNQLLQWHRGQGRRRSREQSVLPSSWFSRDELDDRLDGAVITAALQRLPSPDREIIVMHLWGEMTFEQIADIVGGSKATANRNYARGLRRLQEEFNPVAAAGQHPSGHRPSVQHPSGHRPSVQRQCEQNEESTRETI